MGIAFLVVVGIILILVIVDEAKKYDAENNTNIIKDTLEDMEEDVNRVVDDIEETFWRW